MQNPGSGITCKIRERYSIISFLDLNSVLKFRSDSTSRFGISTLLIQWYFLIKFLVCTIPLTSSILGIKWFHSSFDTKLLRLLPFKITFLPRSSNFTSKAFLSITYISFQRLISLSMTCLKVFDTDRQVNRDLTSRW